MTKVALARIPFEKETALEPDSPALSTEIYNASDAQGALDDVEIVRCPPHVICGPKRTGKTTLAQQIFNKQENVSRLLNEEGCIPVPVEFEKGASETAVRETLATKLLAPVDAETLLEMLSRSPVINQAGHRVILIVSNADNLSNSALRWLLYNVRHLYENPLFSGSPRCQILIDGSFALETITTPDSEFPLPQIRLRDFTKAEQFDFVKSRFYQLDMSLSDDGCNLLWDGTHGDKYLTQALCLNLLENLEEISEGMTFDESDMHKSIERFLRLKPADDPLKLDWINSFVELSSQFATHEFELEILLKNEPEEWDQQSEAMRIAYQGGIVRRTAQSTLETRPFVRNTFEQLRSRVTQVRTIIDTAFAPEGVADAQRNEAETLVNEIMKASYRDDLRTLHIGPAVKLDDTSIEVECQVWGQGSYRGTWQVTTDSSIKIGDELWAILWSWELQPGNREGKIHTFPVKPIV